MKTNKQILSELSKFLRGSIRINKELVDACIPSDPDQWAIGREVAYKEVLRKVRKLQAEQKQEKS